MQLFLFGNTRRILSCEKIMASLKATQNCLIFVNECNSILLQGYLAVLLAGRYLEF
jgi:hypothetical protein